MRTHFTSTERIEANREQLFAWADEGKSYFWMAQQIGLSGYNAAIVSKWFLAQGIRRKPVTSNSRKKEMPFWKLGTFERKQSRAS
jgi:hypothetical protein